METADLLSWVVLIGYLAIQIRLIKKHAPLTVSKNIKKVIQNAFMVSSVDWFWWIVIGVGCLYATHLPADPSHLEFMVFVAISLISPAAFAIALAWAIYKHKTTI